MSGQVHASAVLLLEKNPQHQLNSKPAGPQSLSGQDVDEQNICPCQELKPGSHVIQSVF
jgi:hypothetical protein